MSDTFTKFSEAITHLTDEERAWLTQQTDEELIRVAAEHIQQLDEIQQLPQEEREQARLESIAAYTNHASEYDEKFPHPDKVVLARHYLMSGWLGFEYDIRLDNSPKNNWGKYFWIYSETNADFDAVLILIQEFIRKFRPDMVFTLTWADVCNRSVVGESGGGAVIITATEDKWISTHQWIEDEYNKIKSSQLIEKLVLKLESEGVDPSSFDDIVHDAISSYASSVNNGGLEEQVRLIFDQVGTVAGEKMILDKVGKANDDQ